MSHLIVLTGPHQGQRLPFDRITTVLGRDNLCDVVLESENPADVTAVSRKHAVISRDQDKYYIEDGDGNGKESRNHTFVNDVQVPFPGRVLLKNNDSIRICKSRFVFHDSAAVEPNRDSKDHGEQEPYPDSSSSISVSISHNSSLYLVQPAEKLKLLLEISNRLSHTLDLDSLLPQVVETLLQLFTQADRVFLMLQDDATGALVPRCFKARRLDADSRIGASANIVEQCLKTVEGLLSDDPVPVICAPLWSVDGKAFGILVLDSLGNRKKFVQEDLTLLMGVASQASIALYSAQYHREALARERVNRDLALARDVVKSFLPARLPEIPGYEFFACFESAYEVGGDYYDFVPLAGDRLGILVGDVAGKGVAAALWMARLSAMAWVCLQAEPELAVAVSRLNTLMQPLSLTDRFVTMAALVLDPIAQTLTVVNAGQPPPLLLRGGAGTVEEVLPREKGGLPLGILAGYAYEAHQVALQPGDRLILFSDGVTDARDVHGRQLETQGLCTVLERASDHPQELGERILQAVKKHAAGCSQYDDITLVCFGRMT